MSQQEFVAPEQDNDDAQHNETAYYHGQKLADEQTAWRNYDEPSRRHLLGEKLQPRRRLSPLKMLIVVLALILVATCSLFGLTVSHLFTSLQSLHYTSWGRYPDSGHSITSLSSVQTFAVNGPVNLAINDPADGAIRIHTGSINQVTVSTTMQSEGVGLPSNGSPVQSSAVGNTIAVNASAGRGDENIGVVIDIFTPSNTSMNIQAGSAMVYVDRVNGQIKASTSDGPISVNDSSGLMNLTTVEGDIAVINDNLSGLSAFKSENGNINFAGTLDPKGHYQFSSEYGSIDIALPQDTAFQLSTTISHPPASMNEFGSNSTGNNPRAAIAVSTNEGSISIHKLPE